MFSLRIPKLVSLSCIIALSGCSTNYYANSPIIEEAHVVKTTRSTKLLRALPAPSEKTAVTVYDFQDQTGQFKPNDKMTDYSRAVTQGGLALLNEALLNAGKGQWFDVIERGGLKNLLQERQIIRTMREQYTVNGQKISNLPPMLYAGMLIEGGVTGYDSDVVSGGMGAKYLGIGGDAQYRRDIVTVTLRAVSIATGKVGMSVTTEKTIYSTAVSANVFKFVAFDKLLEMESGFTQNEPPQLAVRQAIEMAVYSLIMEGAQQGMWRFADEKAGELALADYRKRAGEDDVVAVNAAEAPKTIPQAPAKPLATSAPRIKGNAGNAEKKSIFDDIADFLSFGSGEAPAGAKGNPTPYPTVPLPQRNPSAH